MTSEQLERVENAFTRCFNEITNDIDDLNYEGERDGLMLALMACIEAELARQTEPLVIALLESSIDGLRHAAMDYYVSTK